ncbi:prolyl oligopeptidase family serine peptidase [Pseudoroseomonas cervicalis]|uniref:S9 family peptidase n=1 Tax=Teichococcus cervicalis TaxID=204525 RepID=UPI002783FFE8|nr:prolyl oligopeptidase family serine peptidase [Pseudoroseomonas cervicalis]MDQ1080108.1 dipeptidyl aminopeptidase/acylaminoacyl peptidase [Pseudoroseomonas cervicalis]
MSQDDAAALLERLLTTPATSLPAFAGDGRLYVLHDAGGSAQVWEVPAGGGAPRQRTHHADAVAFVAGLPDGGAIFGRDGAGDERIQLYHLPPAGEARPLTEAPHVIHGWGALSPDGRRIAYTANARHPAHTDAWVMDLATGTASCVAEVEGPHELLAWAPDGASLLLATAPRTFESTLLRVALDGAAPPADVTPHDGDARHLNPRWKRDGSAFWLLTDRDGDFLSVAIQAPGAAPRPLYAPPFDVEKLEPSPDHSLLAVVVNEGGYSRLRLLDAATGAVLQEPIHPEGVITKLSWSPDGATLAFDLMGFRFPSSIWLARPGVAAATPLDAAPPPPGLHSWTSIAFPTHDGRQIPGFLALPSGEQPEKGWPVLVWVHGGPAMQALPNWRPDLQAFLALGIAVLVPNVRGSTGYGRAYAALDDREKRLDSVADLAAAHAFLAAHPSLDGSRIGIMGQSYGGWMVLAATTEYPELWACGVDFYGIASWKTFFEKTGPWRIGHRAAEYGDPVRDAALLQRLSPLNRADRIACPLLVAQGLTDPRVPPYESEQIVDALKQRRIPVEYLTFPDEGHGFTKRDNRRRVYNAVLGFFSRHLKN